MRKKYKDFTLVDKDGKIEYLMVNNPDFFKWKPEDILGKKFTQIYTNIDEETSTFMRAIKKNERFVDYEQILRTASGRTVKQVEDIYLLKNGNEVVGAIEFSDYDERRDVVSEYKNDIEERANDKLTLDDIVGQCDEIMDIKAKLPKTVDRASPVLIMGETGTGKELLAHVIHNMSKRRKKDFVYLNCSALPENLLEGILFGVKKGSFTDAEEREGLFKQADGGTLFLDEVDSMPHGIQAKILRAIEEKSIRPIGASDEIYVDVRIIASCNLGINELINSPHIRNDLLFRLCVIQFELPPLRKRGRDVLYITQYYMEHYNKIFDKKIQGISPEAEEKFLSYNWPGNVREIKNLLEGLFPLLKDDIISVDELKARWFNVSMQDSKATKELEEKMLLGDFLDSGKKLGDYLKDFEKKQIEDALATSEDYREAAQKLGISPQLLRYKEKNILE